MVGAVVVLSLPMSVFGVFGLGIGSWLAIAGGGDVVVVGGSK